MNFVKDTQVILRWLPFGRPPSMLVSLLSVELMGIIHHLPCVTRDLRLLNVVWLLWLPLVSGVGHAQAHTVAFGPLVRFPCSGSNFVKGDAGKEMALKSRR